MVDHIHRKFNKSFILLYVGNYCIKIDSFSYLFLKGFVPFYIEIYKFYCFFLAIYIENRWYALMIFDATLESFEEASLRVQKTLTSLKELIYKADVCKEKIPKDISFPKMDFDINKYLTGICSVEDEIERELKELVVFLDIQNEEVEKDVAYYKEMVSRAGIRTKLENISYLVNKKMYLDEGKGRE
ncbi:hypothetical protein EROM_041670 [Encephalitozoon romaleae SJ-2008]|uniref:Uncharacterized protein n=1 Tax=Encephalitozoon romaleae (strain SJ-2008) TaxID=1178016 RepID=I7ARD6_ENCRO|nr:hypothetical protein EROM_041670 [Encephalitozoon romaleae SJ-2008]AFN82932.1 hypothetical protein EROM_041670 [Encephalitozoon romaleae SJ-2008]